MWTSWQVTWVSLSPHPAGLKDLFLFFFQEQSPSDWLVTSSVSGCQRDNTDPLCEEREGSNQEGHLDGAEKHLSSCQRLSAPRWRQPWEREQGNLHPLWVSVPLGGLELVLVKARRGEAAPGRNLPGKLHCSYPLPASPGCVWLSSKGFSLNHCVLCSSL